jgi:hypothetical protein
VSSLRAAIGIGLAIFWLTIGEVRADEPSQKLAIVPGDLEQTLSRGEFDRLEDLASEYRSTQRRTLGGYWALYTFYKNLAGFKGDGCGCGNDTSDVAFEDKHKQLEVWLATKPQSLTARITLANMWTSYAWMRRGHGYGGQTSDAQWGRYFEDLGRADDLLSGIDPAADPMVLLIEMRTAERSENPRSRLDELYVQATKAFPTFIPYYTRRYSALQERWYGRPGEAKAYIQSLLLSPGGEEGKILYAAVAESALNFERTKSELLGTSGVSYSLLINAYGARQRAVGLSDHDWNALMYFATAALDRNGIMFIAKKIGDKWEPELWGSKDNFDTWVNWSARPL